MGGYRAENPAGWYLHNREACQWEGFIFPCNSSLEREGGRPPNAARNLLIMACYRAAANALGCPSTGQLLELLTTRQAGPSTVNQQRCPVSFQERIGEYWFKPNSLVVNPLRPPDPG